MMSAIVLFRKSPVGNIEPGREVLGLCALEVSADIDGCTVLGVMALDGIVLVVSVDCPDGDLLCKVGDL